jgi:enamine deaminase RidA (YjgF/YER057c/UK114 family)
MNQQLHQSSTHRLIHERLSELGLELPAPATAASSYVPAVRIGNVAYTSGQLPLRNGELAATGKVGADITAEDAAGVAAICLLNAIAAAGTLGDLDHARIVKAVVFVASAPGFNAQPLVANGASDLLLAIFGDQGQHARSAVGVAELPLNAPVEVELVVEFP